jgi:adenosylcobyric acid synthase
VVFLQIVPENTNQNARAIFVGGTASNVGKSWMATALCRLLARQGIRVAPFKAQNMSNNSYPCVGGGEIGRSQVAQAAACGLAPEPAMNPVLLKPCSDSQSQVILHGKVWRTLHARDYYQHTDFLRQQALSAYYDLASRFDVVVIEGAGSIAEINLAGRDFTNMSMARAVRAKTLLVADIERGGVFASLLGTLDLLSSEDRDLVKCFAVNRFRGDPSLFNDGVSILERRAGIPCLGVFPFDENLHLDAEDSLSDRASDKDSHPKTAIVQFPRISNTTDFRLLPAAQWLTRPVDRQFQFILLPGTKSTIADLDWLRQTGLADWILGQHAQGATIIGICGGYQMLGETIVDPQGVDGRTGQITGLGLLPMQTIMQPEKTTLVRSAATPGGARFKAYEIHMGQSSHHLSAAPFAHLEDGSFEGIRLGRVIGTYLHGALESPGVVQELFGFSPDITTNAERDFDSLADWLEKSAAPQVLAALTAD